jgi:hypothetical protein
MFRFSFRAHRLPLPYRLRAINARVAATQLSSKATKACLEASSSISGWGTSIAGRVKRSAASRSRAWQDRSR